MSGNTVFNELKCYKYKMLKLVLECSFGFIDQLIKSPEPFPPLVLEPVCPATGKPKPPEISRHTLNIPTWCCSTCNVFRRVRHGYKRLARFGASKRGRTPCDPRCAQARRGIREEREREDQVQYVQSGTGPPFLLMFTLITLQASEEFDRGTEAIWTGQPISRKVRHSTSTMDADVSHLSCMFVVDYCEQERNVDRKSLGVCLLQRSARQDGRLVY